MFLERDGKRYVIDVAAKSIREASQSEPAAPTGGSALFQVNPAHIEETIRRGKNGRMPPFSGWLSDAQIAVGTAIADRPPTQALE